MISKYDQHGQYLFCGSKSILPEGVEAPQETDPRVFGVYEGVADIHQQYHDMATNRPAYMSPRPSPSHHFDYKIKRWIGKASEAWTMVRYERTKRLAACDWVVVKANEKGEAVPADWQAYRQALRDVTQQSDPWTIEWPPSP